MKPGAGSRDTGYDEYTTLYSGLCRNWALRGSWHPVALSLPFAPPSQDKESAFTSTATSLSHAGGTTGLHHVMPPTELAFQHERRNRHVYVRTAGQGWMIEKGYGASATVGASHVRCAVLRCVAAQKKTYVPYLVGLCRII